MDYAEYARVKGLNNMTAKDKGFVRTETAEALKEDIGILKSDVSDLRSDFNAKIDKLTAGHADLNGKIDKLTAGHADLNAKIDQLIAAENERQAVRKHPIVKLAYVVLASVGAIFVAYVGWIGTELFSLNRQMGVVTERLDSADAEIRALTEKVDNLSFDNEFISAVTLKVNGINSDQGYNLQSVGNTALSIEENSGRRYRSFTPLNIEDGSEEFAEDRDGDRQYSAGELINTKILLSYEENGQEIFFYGQYNEKYHWNDFCVINVYENGNLAFVMEANYEDGEVQQYRQAFPYTTSDGKDVWTVSERNTEGEKNTGESWNYYGSDVYQKTFETSNIEVKDMIYIDAVKTWLRPALESYYRGDTSDGVYNDGTGDAYMVKYDENGYIRTLYVGRFKDGNFEDSQNGGSWEIARDPEKDMNYMYFKGAFSDGHAKEDQKEEFEESITQDRIDELISDMEFACPMTWY